MPVLARKQMGSKWIGNSRYYNVRVADVLAHEVMERELLWTKRKGEN